MKVFKYVFMFILIASTMALSGCGGDKFAGKWYALSEDQRTISMLDISKNGENYIIKKNTVYYKAEYKEVGKETIEKEEYAGAFDLRRIKRQYEIPVYEVSLNLTVENKNQKTQVENKGQLGEYTYIEKDKTLQAPSSMGTVVTYQQGGEKDLIKKMKAAVSDFYDKAKAGEIHLVVGRLTNNNGNVIKDYKFNEAIPKELQ